MEYFKNFGTKFDKILKKHPLKSFHPSENKDNYAFIRKNVKFIIRYVKIKRYVTQDTFSRLSKKRNII